MKKFYIRSGEWLSSWELDYVHGVKDCTLKVKILYKNRVLLKQIPITMRKEISNLV